MVRLNRTRRALTLALALSTLLALPVQPANAAATTVSKSVCSIDWRAGTQQVKKLIRCAADRWKVSGGPSKALAVAKCESGFNPKAYASGNAGVFQQATKYWPTRAKTFGFPDYSAFNGRANIIVSIRMAHRWGWGAWSCA